MPNGKIDIILDTETTGLDKRKNRLVEIGCIKLRDYVEIDRFHEYINPGCPIPQATTDIHGITDEFVKDKPRFQAIALRFLNFIGNYNIVAHNGFFDLGFLNEELRRAKLPKINNERLIDSLSLARQKFPNQSNKLDDLCKRYNIDNSKRVYHGALLDAQLLAEIYVELSDARQIGLDIFKERPVNEKALQAAKDILNARADRGLSQLEIMNHREFIANLDTETLWKKYYNANEK